jgi:arylsulfatase A-like enzyme
MDDPDHGSIRKYAEMMINLDENIGRIIESLRTAGRLDNTIVVFTSDNGGERFSDSWPLIGVKGELLEGGIRVPLIISWPRLIVPDAECKQIMTSMDFLPTLLSAAGTEPHPDYPSDGINLMPVITGKIPPMSRTLFWRQKAYGQEAVRSGKWKYLKINEREYLFDLSEDERERADKQDLFPDIFEKLKDQYRRWNASMLPYSSSTFSGFKKDKMADRY